jgi:hypothetical protein
VDMAAIKARRERIENDARCVGCGSTLALCKSQRGKDPTAPEWFGCCARGLLLDIPCDHRANPAELISLLKEIESGEVKSEADELLDSISENPMFGMSDRGRLLRARIMSDWPDDVPMRGRF